MKGVLNFLPRSAVEVVVHHKPCNDGEAAAGLFDYYCDNISFIGIHPKDNLLTDESIHILTDKNVVFVDICFPPMVMSLVSKLVKKAIVLDHHITNQEALPEDMENIKFHFEMGVPGCHLAWQYLRGDVPMPLAIKYIGMYDVFKHKEDLNAVYFNVAFEKPKTLLGWRPIIDDDDNYVQNTIARGDIVFEYKQSVLNTMAEKVEYCDWNDVRIAMINVPYPWVSDMGELLCETNPRNMVAVIWNKQMTGPFVLSFRSNEHVGPDVAKIAQQFGGGGHKHAAAARTEIGPWEIFK